MTARAEQELDSEQTTTSNLRLEVAKLKSMLNDAETSVASLTKETETVKKSKYEAEEGLTEKLMQVGSFESAGLLLAVMTLCSLMSG